jgi:hypothetical protein
VRPSRRTGRFVAGLALFAAVAAPPAAAGGGWRVMENPWFRSLTNADPGRARELLEEMDRFRIAVQKVTNAKVPEDAPPVLVVIFDSAGEFREYSASRRIGGFALSYASDLPDMTIVMPARGTTGDERQTIRHEYVHALTKHRAVPFPRWYEEGVAEVFSLVDIEGADIVVGLPPKDRFRALENARAFGMNAWRPFDEIVSGDMPSHGAHDAYAQYWLLTHYLTFGRPDLQSALNRCLVLSDGMMKPLDAFRTAFRRTPQEMWEDGGMKAYARRIPATRYTLKQPIVAEPFALQPADPAEVQATLAAIKAWVQRQAPPTLP